MHVLTVLASAVKINLLEIDNMTELNWDNPKTRQRLITRVSSVLEWCRFSLTELSPTNIHSDDLREVFGTASNPISKYLREQLLVVDSRGYKPGEVSKSYRLNRKGFNALKAELDRQLQSSKHNNGHVSENPIVKKYAVELASLTFKYKESSNRLWHPLQNIKRTMKDEFWSPYLPYDYDIEACAPTVLLQLSKKYELPKLVTSGVQEYLDNKEAFRQGIVNLTGLSYNDAKRLINSLFNGAKLVPHYTCAAYRLLGYDRALLEALKNDPGVIALRAAIKRIWDRIALVTGLNLSKGKAKWSIYFNWERQILDVIVEEVQKAGIKIFTEHDGFRTSREIDKDAVMKAVKAKTGLELRLSGPGFEK